MCPLIVLEYLCFTSKNLGPSCQPALDQLLNRHTIHKTTQPPPHSGQHSNIYIYRKSYTYPNKHTQCLYSKSLYVCLRRVMWKYLFFSFLMSSSANMCIVAVYNSVPLSLSLANHNHKIEIQQSTKLFPNINNNHHLTNCNHSHPFRCARLCDHDDGVDCRDGDRTSSFCVYYIPLNPPPTPPTNNKSP